MPIRVGHDPYGLLGLPQEQALGQREQMALQDAYRRRAMQEQFQYGIYDDLLRSRTAMQLADQRDARMLEMQGNQQAFQAQQNQVDFGQQQAILRQQAQQHQQNFDHQFTAKQQADLAQWTNTANAIESQIGRFETIANDPNASPADRAVAAQRMQERYSALLEAQARIGSIKPVPVPKSPPFDAVQWTTDTIAYPTGDPNNPVGQGIPPPGYKGPVLVKDRSGMPQVEQWPPADKEMQAQIKAQQVEDTRRYNEWKTKQDIEDHDYKNRLEDWEHDLDRAKEAAYEEYDRKQKVASAEGGEPYTGPSIEQINERIEKEHLRRRGARPTRKEVPKPQIGQPPPQAAPPAQTPPQAPPPPVDETALMGAGFPVANAQQSVPLQENLDSQTEPAFSMNYDDFRKYGVGAELQRAGRGKESVPAFIRQFVQFQPALEEFAKEADKGKWGDRIGNFVKTMGNPQPRPNGNRELDFVEGTVYDNFTWPDGSIAPGVRIGKRLYRVLVRK